MTMFVINAKIILKKQLMIQAKYRVMILKNNNNRNEMPTWGVIKILSL
jgi:hypothetical protein